MYGLNPISPYFTSKASGSRQGIGPEYVHPLSLTNSGFVSCTIKVKKCPFTEKVEIQTMVVIAEVVP